MARMTKTQIEYIRTKLHRKVEELIEKFREKISNGDSMEKIAKDSSLNEFTKWCKEKATRSQLIEAIGDEGGLVFSRITNSKHIGNGSWAQIATVDLVVDSMKRNDASFKFLRSIKALTRVEAVEKVEASVKAKRLELENEAEKILDEVVFAGSEKELPKLIKAFMEK